MLTNGEKNVLIKRWILWKKVLTHWGRVTHICVGKLTIIGSDNGLSPQWRQAIIWTNAGILLIGPLGTNFSEILIEIQTFSFKKMHLKMSSAKWRLFRLGLKVLTGPLCHHWSWPVFTSICQGTLEGLVVPSIHRKALQKAFKLPFPYHQNQSILIEPVLVVL